MTKTKGVTILMSAIRLNDGSSGLPKNPRLIKDDRFRKLCESIERDPEYMTARPIVVDETDVILGGNMRYRALLELGKKEVPSEWVHIVKGWSVEKKRRFILLDNNSYGEYDWDILANEFDLSDLVASGFDDKELAEMLCDVNKKNNDASEQTISNQWMILIECNNENEQTQLLEKLIMEGIKCKALIS